MQRRNAAAVGVAGAFGNVPASLDQLDLMPALGQRQRAGCAYNPAADNNYSHGQTPQADQGPQMLKSSGTGTSLCMLFIRPALSHHKNMRMTCMLKFFSRTAIHVQVKSS